MVKLSKLSKEIFCSLQVEGMHAWYDCPYEEVSYLRTLHRHIFHIKAYRQVAHHDRDIEFIMLKHEIEQYLTDEYFVPYYKLLHFGHKSCEMLAEELINKFNLSRCQVDEDGENGCLLTVIQDTADFDAIYEQMHQLSPEEIETINEGCDVCGAPNKDEGCKTC